MREVKITPVALNVICSVLRGKNAIVKIRLHTLLTTCPKNKGRTFYLLVNFYLLGVMVLLKLAQK